MKNKAMAIGVRTRSIYGALAIMTILLSIGENTMAQTKSTAVVKNIVLVHGGLVDGSGWEAVYNVLKKDGYTVTIVQNPTISLADDVAVTKRAIAAQNGPVILVGHSYGGAVITEAGNDPKVAGLVYIAAFALDKGESVSSLIKDPPPGAPVPPLLPPVGGFLLLDKGKFPASFADDVATTKRAIAEQNGPVILVGHSYGGAVITEAGNDPKVTGLVYIAAFAPDKGESVSTLIKNTPPGAPVLPILPPVDGYLLFDKAKFPAFFAGDVSPEKAAFMADSQVPWGVNALNGTISEPAWKSKPSWYLVTTEDKMIPPEAQRQMAKRAGAMIVEVKSSHSVFVSHPQSVATLIEKAAKGAALAAAH